MEDLTPVQLKQRMETEEPLQLIDVREPYEWNTGNLERHGARHVPMGELLARIGELDRDVDLVIYCRTGARSSNVGRYLSAQGFGRVYNLKGGLEAWARDVDPDITVA
jgi:rhodanese-related sulfurtransferase